METKAIKYFLLKFVFHRKSDKSGYRIKLKPPLYLLIYLAPDNLQRLTKTSIKCQKKEKSCSETPQLTTDRTSLYLMILRTLKWIKRITSQDTRLLIE